MLYDWIFELLPFTMSLLLASAIGLKLRFTLAKIDKVNTFDDQAPLVSIIVPCRNPGANLEKKIHRFLGQSYQNIELIVVDDRSKEPVPQELMILQINNPRLKIIQNKVLPSGWSANNWALHLGSKKASGHYLLFTSLQCTLTSQHSLASMVHHAQSQNLEHLSLIPSLQKGLNATLALKYCVQQFSDLFAQTSLLPKSSSYLPNSFVNLITKDTYLSLNGHRYYQSAKYSAIHIGQAAAKQMCRTQLCSANGLITLDSSAVAASSANRSYFSYQFYQNRASATLQQIYLTSLQVVLPILFVLWSPKWCLLPAAGAAALMHHSFKQFVATCYLDKKLWLAYVLGLGFHFYQIWTVILSLKNPGKEPSSKIKLWQNFRGKKTLNPLSRNS